MNIMEFRKIWKVKSAALAKYYMLEVRRNDKTDSRFPAGANYQLK